MAEETEKTEKITNQKGFSLDSISEDEGMQKKLITYGGVIVVLLTVLGMGFGYFKDSGKQKVDVQSADVFKFEEDTLKKFNDSKMEAPEFLTKFNGLLDEINNSSLLLSVNAQVFNKLKDNTSVQTPLMAFTEKLLSKVDKGSFAHYIYTTQLSVLYENNDKSKEALDTLLSLDGSSYQVEEDYQLDLARLYLSNGKKDKASQYLKNIINKFPDSDQAKMAHGYAINNNLSL